MDNFLIGTSIVAGSLTGAAGAGSAGSKDAKEFVSFVCPKAEAELRDTAGKVGAIIGGGSGGISGGYFGAATMAGFLRR